MRFADAGCGVALVVQVDMQRVPGSDGVAARLHATHPHTQPRYRRRLQRGKAVRMRSVQEATQ